MAEAHQGVAFSFHVTEDEGLHINVSFEAFKAVFLSGLRTYRKFLIRFIVIKPCLSPNICFCINFECLLCLLRIKF